MAGKQNKGIPYYTPSPKFDQMTPDQLIGWLDQKIAWLTAKKERELRYVQRRASRGTQTPTDDAYNADQPHEAELLAFLEHWKQSLIQTGSEK